MTSKSQIDKDIRAMSFEQALAELETIVDRLETGDVALEESFDIYQRGSQLRAYCDEKLKNAQARIEKITSAGAATEALDAE
jgi:exodeoxyribonuclease VII small subunit